MLPFGIHLLPIPDVFWSAYLEKPFEQCVDCSCELNGATVYVVQKRFVGREAVFEMAICDQCRQRLTDTYSVETRAALTKKMGEFFSAAAARLENAAEQSGGEWLLDRCMNFCLVCQTSRSACQRYSLAGLFRREQVVVQCSTLGQSPVMICEECEESLSSLISQQTRDAWDRFVGEHFDGPPGIDLDVPYDAAEKGFSF